MKFIANGFATVLPEGWEDRSLITLVGPIDDNRFAANIIVLRERIADTMSVEEYAAQQKEAMQAELADLETLDERPTTVQRAPAYQRLQRLTIDGQVLQQAQTFILANGCIFAITCTATSETFDHHIPAFRQIIDQWRNFDPQTTSL